MALVLHALWLWCPTEDGYISFRFARNLAEGFGFVWNPGGPPVEGFTNPSLVLFSAGVLRMGGDPTIAVPVLCLAASLLLQWLSYHLGRRAFGLKRSAALIAPLFLAASGPVATWASSGLEANLFGLLSLGCIACWERAVRKASSTWAVVAALVGFLATSTRMEGVLIFGLLWALAWAYLGRDAEGRNKLLMSAGLFGLLLAGLTAWRWTSFGYPLPNTFYAKTGGGLEQARRGVVHVSWFGLLFALPLLPGFLGIWRRWPRIFGASACGLILTVYSIYIAVVGGDYMAMFRFFVPVLAPLYLLFAAAVSEGIGSSWRRNTAVAIGLMGTLVHSTPLEGRVFPRMSRNHGTWRGVELERWHVARLTAIGRMLEEVRASESASVFTDAIGAIGYHSRLDVYGQHGLVDPVLAHRKQSASNLGSGLPGHDRRDLVYSLGLEPTWFLFNRDLSAEPGQFDASRDQRFTPAVLAIIDQHYDLRSEWIDDPINGEAGWLSFFERR